MSQSTNTGSEQTKQEDNFKGLADFASEASKGLDDNEKLFFALAVVLVFLTGPLILRLQGDHLFYISLILVLTLTISLVVLLFKASRASKEKREKSKVNTSLHDTLEILSGKRDFLRKSLAKLKAIREEFEGIQQNDANGVYAADSIEKKIDELIFQMNEELKKINSFFHQYQDYKELIAVPKDYYESIWEEASKQ